MTFHGIDFIRRFSDAGRFSAKMIFNANGAVFFPSSQQHKDSSVEGIRYRDNYEGNAMAAMLSPGRIEARYHSSFKPAQVRAIIRSITSDPSASFMASWKLFYQGKPVD